MTQKTGQRTLIGGNITVTVIGIKRGKVKLGIEAPADVAIVREGAKRKEPRVPVCNATLTESKSC
jgi:carbon storage regulator CsrA